MAYGFASYDCCGAFVGALLRCAAGSYELSDQVKRFMEYVQIGEVPPLIELPRGDHHVPTFQR